MKLKKEYIILFLIIAILSTYLILQKKGKTHYTLPQLIKIEEKKISQMKITKGNSEITLQKKENTWLILPGKYPADKNLVEKMVDSISDIKLTALVSQSRNYSLYELDEHERIEIEIFGQNESLRKIAVGKTASSRSHSFVKLDTDYKVYHARGNLKNIYDKTVSELRDKKIMAFSEDIDEVSLRKGKREMTIVKTTALSESVTQEQKGEKEEQGSGWQTRQGEPVKKQEIEDIITTLSNLRCDDFIEDKTKEDFTSPLYTVSLKGEKTYSLYFFEKKDNKYPATSSESEYPFFISEWKAKKIMKDLNTLTEREE